MLEFLTRPSSVLSLYFLPVLSLIALCLFSRVYLIHSLNVNDPASQYFYALKAFLSPSISPLIKSRDSIYGRNHYPLSFYWHCGKLAKLILYVFRKYNFSSTHTSPEYQPYLNLSFGLFFFLLSFSFRFWCNVLFVCCFLILSIQTFIFGSCSY